MRKIKFMYRIPEESILWNFASADEPEIFKDILKHNGKAVIFGAIFATIEGQIKDQIMAALKWFNSEKINCETIDDAIWNTLGSIYKILEWTKIFTKFGIEKVLLPNVAYRLSLYWMIDMLERAGVDISIESKKSGKTVVKTGHGEVAKDVTIADGQAIYNILQDNVLTPFLIILKSFWIVDFSENVWNDFEREKELKILKINQDEVIAKLKKLGAEKTFEWEVIDTYYDYPSLRLDKGDDEDTTSFRTREKIDLSWKKEHFYTIKRKLKDSEKASESKDKKTKSVNQVDLRDCFEKEFSINDFGIFKKILSRFGLKKSRRKVKQRISYKKVYKTDSSGKKHYIKFDIDTYRGIPTLIEIECDDKDVVGEYILKLGLENHEVLLKWSRGLYRHYNKYEEYEKNYEVVEDKRTKWGKMVKWNDGENTPLYTGD